MRNVKVAVVCGFGVYFKGKFYGEEKNGNIVDICDTLIRTGMRKFDNEEIDYLIFSGGKTKNLDIFVYNNSLILSEAQSMKERAFELFPYHWREIDEKTFVEERSFHSYQNLEKSLELIANKGDTLKSIEIISLASKELFFDVYAENMPKSILAQICPTPKLIKNVNYFFCPVGEMSPTEKNEAEEFKKKYSNGYDFYSHEFFKLAVNRDVCRTVYSPDQKEIIGINDIPRIEIKAYKVPQYPVENKEE